VGLNADSTGRSPSILIKKLAVHADFIGPSFQKPVFIYLIPIPRHILIHRFNFINGKGHWVFLCSLRNENNIPLGKYFLSFLGRKNPIIEFFGIHRILATFYKRHGSQFITGAFCGRNNSHICTFNLELYLVMGISDSNRDFTNCNTLARGRTGFGILIDIGIEFFQIIKGFVFITIVDITNGGNYILCRT